MIFHNNKIPIETWPPTHLHSKLGFFEFFIFAEPLKVKRTFALQASAGGEVREHLFKVLVIGELGTGKTSIIKRYVHQFFSQHYKATVSLTFDSLILLLPALQGHRILDLW